MMKTRIAINGFGRIGRLTLRAFSESSKKYDFDIVAVNDLQNIDAAIHLLKYDSAHGRFSGEIQKISDDEFFLDGKKIVYFSQKSVKELPWNRLNVNLVLECTGTLKTKELCGLHLESGTQKVLVSCPVEKVDNTIIYGINHDSLDSKNDVIVSNASCTTNCLAHIIKATYNATEIVNGFATTVHSYTGDQRLVDMNHGDLRRSRAAANSMIPTSTGATRAIEKIFPDLSGKLSGLSIRVPTQNVSLVDFTFTAAKKITENDLCRAIIQYSENISRDVFYYTEEPLVSVDFNHSPQSAIVDLSLIKVIDNTMGHIVAWYDNEWGFSNRLLDTAQKMLHP
ncbi:MAG: type I glyceraldehyde-3-phosphate dehydrogenase [Holosporaceae bacterium]|jgi:glyceraldehyde 3-phosphate dehydrogenase|nr:type I glyceraldehyde-3-phosphate dehydrogenase [Holosporaceae bacterium]